MSDESSPPEQRLPDREADSRERADSIAPMSAPIVTIEETGAAISEPSPPMGVPGVAVPQPAVPEPASLEAAVLEAIAIEAAAVPEAGAAPRRLSPPPKPRSVPPSAEQQPYFAPPGFVSPLAASLRTEASEGSLPEQGTPRPSVPGTAPAASRPSTGSLPPTAVFPKASTRPPPTLPAGTRPSQYPWAVPATPETVIMRPRASSPVKSSPFDHVRTGVSSIPMSIREPVLPPARPSVRTGEPSLPSARRTTGQSPSTEGSGPALPPARRAASQPAPDETGEEASARGVVLPRALRDSGPPGARPPASKPRFVPQQLRKDTPAVAIQAMRIIAVGADDVPRSLVQRPAEARAADTAPSVEHAREQVPTQQSPVQPALTPQADAQQVVPQPEPQELPPALPEAALLEVPPIPEEALQDVSQPMLVELEPATTVEVSSAAQELELYQLSAPPPEAIIVPQAIPDDDVAAIESQPEDAAAASVRKRPPPPKRVSVPSAAGESQPEEVTFTAPVGAPSERPVPAARPVASTPSEAAPRQPPPAPSRVPRDSVPKQLAKPEPPERKPDSAAVDSEEKPRPRAAPRRLWWDELFGEDFSRANTRLSEAQIDQEATFIEESLAVAPGAVVLDLGCGEGYHAVELASRGYGIVGYDLSLHQLSLAQEVAHERGQKLNFLQGDMREMAFEEVFDGMYCWNTTFGYFEEEKNVLVAQRMFAALKPGGTLLLDVANRDFVAMNQPSSVWYEGDACVCMDDMSMDFFTSRLRVKRSLILDDGRTRECHYSIRLYSLHELGRILHDIGFRVTEASGHPSTPGVFLGQSSPRIIILAQRP